MAADKRVDPKQVAKALRELEAAGTEIESAPKPAGGKKLANSAISDLEKGVHPAWDAWISWTKSW
jgi:hypothetical protein